LTLLTYWLSVLLGQHGPLLHIGYVFSVGLDSNSINYYKNNMIICAFLSRRSDNFRGGIDKVCHSNIVNFFCFKFAMFSAITLGLVFDFFCNMKSLTFQIFNLTVVNHKHGS